MFGEPPPPPNIGLNIIRFVLAKELVLGITGRNVCNKFEENLSKIVSRRAQIHTRMYTHTVYYMNTR